MMMAGHEKSEKGRGNKATAKRFSSTLNRPQNGDITTSKFRNLLPKDSRPRQIFQQTCLIINGLLPE